MRRLHRILHRNAKQLIREVGGEMTEVAIVDIIVEVHQVSFIQIDAYFFHHKRALVVDDGRQGAVARSHVQLIRHQGAVARSHVRLVRRQGAVARP